MASFHDALDAMNAQVVQGAGSARQLSGAKVDGH